MARELNVEQAVRDGLTRYPTLFRTRADVLWHMLVGFGNGYEWENGGPVAVHRAADRDPFQCARNATAEARERFDRDPGHLMVDFYLDSATDYRDDIATVLDGVAGRAQRMALTPPICPRQPAHDEYSFLGRNDARPDWAQAIAEMRVLYTAEMDAQDGAARAGTSAARRLAESIHESSDPAALADALLSLPDGRQIVIALADRLKKGS